MTFRTVVILAILLIAAVIGFSFLTGGITVQKQSISTGASTVNEPYYPAPTNYAVDQTSTISIVELAMLNAKLKAMDNEKHQFGVVFVETTKPLDIQEYSIKLAEKWKVGYKGIDNGAIIVIAVKDRQVRIEVGYGLEGDINDAAAGRILDEKMVPLLKEGKWYEAVVAGLDELNNRIK